MAMALSFVILSLNPVHKITGISGFMLMSLLKSPMPVMPGMVISVMTRSNLSGLVLNTSSASVPLAHVVT